MKWDDWVKTRKVQLKAKRKKKNQEGLGQNTGGLIKKKHKKDWVETRNVWFKNTAIVKKSEGITKSISLLYKAR